MIKFSFAHADLQYNLVSNSLGENVFTALLGFVSLTNQTFNFSSYEGFVFIMHFNYLCRKIKVGNVMGYFKKTIDLAIYIIFRKNW